MKNQKASKIIKALMPFLSLVVVYAIFKVLQPERFGTAKTMYVLLQQSMVHSIFACGFYYLLTMGIFDLSVGVNVVLSAMAGAKLADVIGFPGLIIGALVTSVLISLLSSVIISYIDAPPIMVTISFVIIYEAISIILVGGVAGVSLASEYKIIGRAPFNMIPGLLVLIVSAIILKYTKIGTYIVAIGTNQKIAESAGINIKKTKIIVFIICGIMAGIYAITSISYSGTVAGATNLSSVTSIFKPIMACMFATAFKKNLNPMISLPIGCMFLNLVSNGLMTNGLEAALQNIIVGFAMIIIVRFSSNARKYDIVSNI